MNAPVSATESSALATVTDQPPFLGPTTSSVSLILNDEHMAMMFKFAEMMARGVATVPKHLQNNPSDCLAVVMQATQWGMNPFAVGQKTHIVNGFLGYEAQLVNAVLQSTRAIDGEFSYEFKGTAPAIECRVGAVIKGNKEITWGEWLNANSVTTKNSPLWKTNVKQQMGYLQVKNWARLYCPGAILGVHTPDELESMPPKDMGAAQVVKKEVPEALLLAARAAADKGRAAFAEWWAKALPPERSLLVDEVNDLKRRTQDADAARTVENTDVGDAAADTSAPANTSTAPDSNPDVVVTFAQVSEMLNKAKTADALDIACDWIKDVVDDGQRGELTAMYDGLKAKLTK